VVDLGKDRLAAQPFSLGVDRMGFLSLVAMTTSSRSAKSGRPGQGVPVSRSRDLRHSL
jgi:hypothetical protein